MTATSMSVPAARVFRALSWESLRLAWRPVVGVTLACCAMAALYRRMLEPLGGQQDALVFTSMLFTLLVVMPLTILTCRADGRALGFEPRLFRLPVETSRLVAQRLGFAWITVVAMQTTVALFLLGLYGDRWPLAGPALLQGAAVVWVCALTWTFGRRPYLIAPVGLALLAVLQTWLRPRLAEDPLWRELTPGDVAWLLTLTAAGGIVAWVGVERSRRLGGGGGRPGRLRVAERISDSVATLAGPSGGRAFRSSSRARLWMEWREKGRLVVAWALLGLVAQMAAGSVRGVDAESLWSNGISYAGLALLAFPALSGFLHGRFDPSSRNPGIDRFRASRPVGDTRLAWGILLSAALAAAAAVLAVLAALAVLAVGLILVGVPGPVEGTLASLGRAVGELGLFDRVLFASIPLLGIWGAMGGLAAAALTGRNWVISVAAGSPLALALVGILGSRLLDRDLFPLALPLVGVAVVVAPPAVVAVFALAVRRGLLPVRWTIRLLLAAGALGVLLALRQASFAEALFGSPELIERTTAACVAIVALAVFPLAAAPLALRWNRHR